MSEYVFFYGWATNIWKYDLFYILLIYIIEQSSVNVLCATNEIAIQVQLHRIFPGHVAWPRQWMGIASPWQAWRRRLTMAALTSVSTIRMGNQEITSIALHMGRRRFSVKLVKFTFNLVLFYSTSYSRNSCSLQHRLHPSLWQRCLRTE
jgi:hypothetical protein